MTINNLSQKQLKNQFQLSCCIILAPFLLKRAAKSEPIHQERGRDEMREEDTKNKMMMMMMRRQEEWKNEDVKRQKRGSLKHLLPEIRKKKRRTGEGRIESERSREVDSKSSKGKAERNEGLYQIILLILRKWWSCTKHSALLFFCLESVLFWCPSGFCYLPVLYSFSSRHRYHTKERWSRGCRWLYPVIHDDDFLQLSIDCRLRQGSSVMIC